jgi:hypothetical protein
MTDNPLFLIMTKEIHATRHAGNNVEAQTPFNHVKSMLEEYKADIDDEEAIKVDEIIRIMMNWSQCPNVADIWPASPVEIADMHKFQENRLKVAIMNLNPIHVDALVYNIEHDLPYSLYNIVKQRIEEKRNGRPDSFNMMIQKLRNNGSTCCTSCTTCYNLSEQILQVGRLKNECMHPDEYRTPPIYPLLQIIKQFSNVEVLADILDVDLNSTMSLSD